MPLVCLRFLLFFCLCSSSFAAIESYDFQDDEQRERYQQLSQELRCPKCQNQNLADSDSQIAADLRKELHAQLLAGKSDAAIIDFMRERYGDFVLYKPRMQRNTLLLWLGPVGLVLLVVGGLLWFRRLPVAAGKVPAFEGMVSDTGTPAPMARAVPQQLIHLVSILAVCGVAVGSLALYRHLGSLQALQITELGHSVFSGALSAEEQAVQQAQLLTELDDWLATHPQQEKFLYMRARVLAESGQWERATADFRDLVARFPDQDNLLAEYAQVMFLKNQRVLNDEAASLLKQALQVNPHNVTALGLLGMSAFEQKDYRGAVDFWQRLLQVIPADSPQAGTIAAGVARARELGGIGAETVAEDIRLGVQVVIDEAAQARPEETVFVFLRAAAGPRMPLAAVRTTVSALAQPLLLDTATSPMRSRIDLAAIERFEIVARLSRSGQPQAAAGDWEGVVSDLARQQLSGRDAFSVTINQAVVR